jgi:hypothetical protein
LAFSSTIPLKTSVSRVAQVAKTKNIITDLP